MYMFSKFMLLALAIAIPTVTRAENSPMEIFEQRIMPIFRSPNPSSCVQCHLASVDLKNYILPSHEATFLSLKSQGLINLGAPRKSKILTLIQMGDQDSDSLAKRIHEKQRLAELGAFQAWVVACCADPDLAGRKVDADTKTAQPASTNEIIRHARKNRILDSFVRNVWSQRMRCFPCHTPGEIDSTNPKHKKPAENYAKLLKTHGARMNLFKETPEQTMRSMIANSRKSSAKALPLLNFKDAEQSLLVLKPTSKLPPKDAQGQIGPPSSTSPVSHMGGLKMHVDDMSYKAIVNWITDLGKVMNEGYQTTADLPSDTWIPTMKVLRLKDIPEAWAPGSLVQLFIHTPTRDANVNAWNSDPIAFTQGIVTPRRIVNGPLTMLGIESAELLPGTYRVRIFVDAKGKIRTKSAAILDASDYQGSLDIEADWKDGFPQAEFHSVKQLQTEP
jgi:hypothetical protein